MTTTVRVISLDRTPERLARFRALNPLVAIEPVVAVDGRELDRQACIDAGFITQENHYSIGAVATARSHVALWRRCAAAAEPFHIAEDDVILRRDFAATSARLLAGLTEWDIVLWCWNFDWPVLLSLAPGVPPVVVQCTEIDIGDRTGAFMAGTTPPLLAALASAAGTGCYAISPSGARRLLQLCLPIGAARPPYVARPGIGWLNHGLDTELSRHYPNCRAFIALPPLAVAPNAQDDSTIRGHLAAMHDPAIANRAPNLVPR